MTKNITKIRTSKTAPATVTTETVTVPEPVKENTTMTTPNTTTVAQKTKRVLTDAEKQQREESKAKLRARIEELKSEIYKAKLAADPTIATDVNRTLATLAAAVDEATKRAKSERVRTRLNADPLSRPKRAAGLKAFMIKRKYNLTDAQLAEVLAYGAANLVQPRVLGPRKAKKS